MDYGIQKNLDGLEEVTTSYFAYKHSRIEDIVNQEASYLEIEICKIESKFANFCKRLDDLEILYNDIDVIYSETEEIFETIPVNKKEINNKYIVYILIIAVLLIIFYIFIKKKEERFIIL